MHAFMCLNEKIMVARMKQVEREGERDRKRARGRERHVSYLFAKGE